MFSDTCYVLSFAVIMLNTSLHNPNVKDKPSVQRFTAMNRGINDGGDLPEDLLRVRLLSQMKCFSVIYWRQWTHVESRFPSVQNLYDSIKNEPFKIPEDDGNDLTHTFFNPDREGWLLKLGMCSVLISQCETAMPSSGQEHTDLCRAKVKYLFIFLSCLCFFMVLTPGGKYKKTPHPLSFNALLCFCSTFLLPFTSASQCGPNLPSFLHLVFLLVCTDVCVEGGSLLLLTAGRWLQC